MNDEQPSNSFDDMRRGLNWTMCILDGLAWSVRMLLHYRIGVHQPGLSGGIAFLSMVTLGVILPRDDAMPLLMMAALFAFVSGMRRAAAHRRERTGDYEHSWCPGYSYLGHLLPFLPHRWITSAIEPLFVIVIGFICTNWSVPLGVYLIVCGFSLALIERIHAGAELRQLRRMRDQYLSQRNRIIEFRDFMGRGGLS